MIGTVQYDDITEFQAQMAQCGPSTVHEINLRDVLDADFGRRRGITGRRRTTLSHLGLESGIKIMINDIKHSTEVTVSRLIEPCDVLCLRRHTAIRRTIGHGSKYREVGASFE